MSNIDIYDPSATSLPGRCIAYFMCWTDEELSSKDIAMKFDTPATSVYQLLKEAVEHQRLSRNGVIYSAGARLGGLTRAVIKAVDAPKTRASSVRTNHLLDFTTLVVEDGIPAPRKGKAAESKWEPLFAKLVQPGQSILVPVSIKGALAAEAIKRGKKQLGTFKVAKVNATEARIWRTA